MILIVHNNKFFRCLKDHMINDRW